MKASPSPSPPAARGSCCSPAQQRSSSRTKTVSKLHPRSATPSHTHHQFHPLIMAFCSAHVVVCLVTSLDTSRGYFSWPETFPGEVAGVKCENGTSVRTCSIEGEWEKPDTSNCYVSTNELFRYIEQVCGLLDGCSLQLQGVSFALEDGS